MKENTKFTLQLIFVILITFVGFAIADPEPEVTLNHQMQQEND